MRCWKTLGLLSIQVVMVLQLVSCKGSARPSEKHAQLSAPSGTSAVQGVLAFLTAKLGGLRADPRDSFQTTKIMDAYASAYSDADVTDCPDDFRKQFYTTRQAWVESATALQQEAVYLQQNPDQNVVRGGHLSVQAAMLAQNSASAMENALSQHQELRAIARKYGVDWRIEEQH